MGAKYFKSYLLVANGHRGNGDVHFSDLRGDDVELVRGGLVPTDADLSVRHGALVHAKPVRVSQLQRDLKRSFFIFYFQRDLKRSYFKRFTVVRCASLTISKSEQSLWGGGQGV